MRALVDRTRDNREHGTATHTRDNNNMMTI